MDRDNDNIEVHFIKPRQLLKLDCHPAAFSRITTLLREDALLDELTTIAPDVISQVWIVDAERSARTNQPGSWWKDRIALFGCAFVAIVFGVVFGAGILALSGYFDWLQH